MLPYRVRPVSFPLGGAVGASVAVHAVVLGMGCLLPALLIAPEHDAAPLQVRFVAANDLMAAAVAPQPVEAPAALDASARRVVPMRPVPRVRARPRVADKQGKAAALLPALEPMVQDVEIAVQHTGAPTDDALRALVAPEPVYPLLARRKGWEGKLVVVVTVAPTGHVTQAVVGRSSGFALLDEAAVQGIARWVFEASPAGRQLNVPVVFALTPRR